MEPVSISPETLARALEANFAQFRDVAAVLAEVRDRVPLYLESRAEEGALDVINMRRLPRDA